MWSNLRFSLSTFILLLSKALWAFAVAFTNENFEGVTKDWPFELEWTGDGTVSDSCLLRTFHR